MLFHVQWEFIDTSEEGERSSLQLFQNWQPPAGVDVKGFYGFADSTGGVLIAEVDSAATLQRLVQPWVPWLRFATTPILPIEESAGIGGEAIAWRDSIG